MSRKLIAGLRTVPMTLVMGTIFMLSHQPGDTLHLPPLQGIDKVAHAVVYGVLATTVIFAFSKQFKERNYRIVLIVTIFFCFLFGISDEFHQSFVPGRSTSGLDLLADVCGALLTCIFSIWLRKHQQGQTVVD
jgi:VanZ family protein